MKHFALASLLVFSGCEKQSPAPEATTACASQPQCPSGFEPAETCKPSETCSVQTACGQTVYCQTKPKEKGVDPVVDLTFTPVELNEFPAVVTKEFFGRQQPDGFEFVDAFIPSLEAKFGAKIEEVRLFNGGDSRNSRAFIYFEDLSIRGAEFTGDDNLRSWLVALAESFDGSSEHRVDSSGMNGSRFTAWDDLAANPLVLANKYAPKSHHKTELTDEKKKFFTFQSNAGESTYDSAKFQSALAAFLKSRGATATSPDAAGLTALEAAVGAPLPNDFKALYGATDGVKGLFYDFDLLSASKAKAQHDSWMAIYNDWSLEDLQSHQRAEPGIYAVYFNPRWIPFVDLVGGNYLAVDLGPASGGTYGQIITMGRDVDGKRLVAKNMTEFLQKCATYDGSKGHELYSVFGALKF
ncbi:MAG: SMI1/KNR4 family protein [bacterium]